MTDGSRVLIVDDNFEDRIGMAFPLEQVGLQTKSAKNESEAIELAKTFSPDIVLMDIELTKPDKFSGIELASRLRSDFSIPSLYVSGHLDCTETTRLAEKTKPLGLLKKPCPASRLCTEVEEALGFDVEWRPGLRKHVVKWMTGPCKYPVIDAVFKIERLLKYWPHKLGESRTRANERIYFLDPVTVRYEILESWNDSTKRLERQVFITGFHSRPYRPPAFGIGC